MVVAPTALSDRGRIRKLCLIATLALIVDVTWAAGPAQAAVYEQPASTWGVQGCPPRVSEDCPRVWAMAATRDRIYVGGQFTQAVSPDGDTTAPRSNLMAIDAATGELIAGFAPNPNGVVRSLALSADGTRLFVGGDYGTIGGAVRQNLAAVDPATGAALPGWRADASNRVNALVAGNGRLYAGGGFDILTDGIQRWPRDGVAALSPETGAVDPGFSASVGGGVTSLVLSADRTRLLVGGDYISLNGRARTNLGAVDATTGNLDDAFLAGGLDRVFAVAADGERVYAAMGGGGGRLEALDQRTGARLWQVRGDGDFQAVAVLGGVVYGGGHFVEKLLAVDARTGSRDPFSPAVNSGGGVWSLLAGGRDLHLGGDFTLVSGARARHYARLPGPPAPPAAPLVAPALAGDASATVSWAAPAEDGGSAVSGYVVTPYRAGTAEAAWRAAAATTTLTVTGLRNGAPYRFTVAAENAMGTGAAAETPGEVVPRTVPAAPAAVGTVPAEDGITVTWAAPPDDGGSPVTGYLVVPHRDGRPGPPRAVPVGDRALTVSGVDKGTPYRFTVAAANAAGNGPASALSAEAVYRTPPGPPVRPAAAAGDHAVTVSWEPPSDNGGSPLVGYLVTPYRDGVPGAPLAVPADETAATVTGVANGARYSVTVTAANALGRGAASAPTSPVTPRAGYWMVAADSRVYPFGDVGAFDPPAGASPAAAGPAAATVDLEPTPTLEGYWTVTAGGAVTAHGDATHQGGLPAGRLAGGETITSLSATASGSGYWLFTSAGRVIPFGDARHYGDLTGVALNARVLDSVGTPSGRGYYMVAADGGIFTFGDAVFAGSMGGQRLNAPVESLVPDGDGTGYWLVATDGGVFAFQAPFRGSMGGAPLNEPITGMVRNGNGYLMVAADGGIFNFSDRPFLGSLGGAPPRQPIVAVAAAR